jgi:hypothetical protein
MPTRGPTISNSRGTTSSWMSNPRSEWMRSSVRVCDSFENAITTRSTLKREMISGSSSGGPRSVTLSSSTRRSLGRLSTKPIRLMPYSGCWSSLRAMSCPTSPPPTITVFCM